MKTKILLSVFLICTSAISFGQWTYTNLSSPKKFMGVATSGTKAYFAGGGDGSGTLSLVESYDVETGTWTNIGNLSISRQVIEGTSCGSKLFFGGGVNSNMNIVYSTVDIYDYITEQWSAGQLSVARFDIAALSHSSKVFFAGGCNYSIVCTDVVDIYDTLTGNWTTSNLSIARAGMAYAVVGDQAVFAGGFLSGGNVSNRVDIYNFTSNTWTTANLSEARVWARAVAIGDKVIIAGGIKDFPDVPSNVVDIYNSSDGTWTTATLSGARAWIAGGLVNNKAIFAGGSNVANGGIPYDFTNIIDIYDEVTNSWSVDVLANPRTSQGLAVGDYFLVAGGTGALGLLSSVEICHLPTTIHIPADYPTIQLGIAAANPGDTVLVSDGLYYENINFLGKKPLVVASEFLMDGDTNHISNTIINGSQPENPDMGTVVTFDSGEDTTSVLCGFTITGGTGTLIPGFARMGGGVGITGTGCQLQNNYIEYNEITSDLYTLGGGICAGGPTEPLPWIVLRNNRINHNKAISLNDQGSGGGMEIYYPLIMVDNQISYNEANGINFAIGGGARLVTNWGPIELYVRNNLITHNKAESDAQNTIMVLSGGVTINGDISGNFTNNIISNNENIVADGQLSYGPGLLIDLVNTGDLLVENNIITNNRFTGGYCIGGGLSIYNSEVTIQNNVIMGNSGTYGGGIGIQDNLTGMAVLLNNTVTGNDASTGSGLWAQSANAVVVNTIIYGNTPPGSSAIFEEESTLEVRYSDVEGEEIWPGDGNMNIDPEFQADGYHLDYHSPLLNEGVSTVLINGEYYDCPLYDIDGDERPFEWTNPDIGADEAPWHYVSVEESISSEVCLYPNPANQFVKINCQKGISIQELTIYNQTGQKVYRGIPENNTLDISKLQPGLYVVEVLTKEGNVRKKLVVK